MSGAERAVPRFGGSRSHLLPSLAAGLAVVAAVSYRLAMSRSRFVDHGQVVLGVVAGGLLLLILAFAARKVVYGTRLGRLRFYYIVHVWAGVLWGPVVWLHAGGQARGLFYAALAWTSALAWFSGLLLPGLQVAVLRSRQLLRRPGDAEDAGLLDDLLQARHELRTEIEQLRGDLTGVARQEADDCLRRVRDALGTATLLRPSRLGAARRRLMDQCAEAGREGGSVRARLLEVAIALRGIEVRIALQRVREWWLGFHLALAAPATTLAMLHTALVLWYD